MYLLGVKALKRLAIEQNVYAYFQAKLSSALFKGEQEKAMFAFVDQHYHKFNAIPTVPTLEAKFPEVKGAEVPEPIAYYVDQLEQRFAYDLISQNTQLAREALKANQGDTLKAEEFLKETLQLLAEQRYRNKILDVGPDVPELLLKHYHDVLLAENPPAYFGWPYMDERGGVQATEIASFVGRPAMGKSWSMLYIALHNWMDRHQNGLFVSMEMSNKSVAQRIGALYASVPAGQVVTSGLSDTTFIEFGLKLAKMPKEPAKLYVVDGNIATSVDDIYSLAATLGCKRVYIDGAYLLRHKNPRLDRYTRVAENVELMKKYTTNGQVVTFASWQFSRQAAQKKAAKNKQKESLEDIGYSDAIGQVSAIVIGILQEEGVETIIKRRLELLKGRNGEVGGFDIHWEFDNMNFKQIGVKPEDKPLSDKDEIDYV